jgi:hypothetical protein
MSKKEKSVQEVLNEEVDVPVKTITISLVTSDDHSAMAIEMTKNISPFEAVGLLTMALRQTKEDMMGAGEQLKLAELLQQMGGNITTGPEAEA